MVTRASASGKVILFGEHAVVYGRPAVAAPVGQARATAAVEDLPGQRDVLVIAPDLGRRFWLSEADSNEPLAHIVRQTLEHLGAFPAAGLSVTVRSDLPVACGMGSGAAVSTAIVRALAEHLGCPLEPATISALVYETEKLHHGHPSGIDNTVIAYERPVYFVRGRPPCPLTIHTPFPLLIGNTGVACRTRDAVNAVRQAWETERERYEALFDAIGRVADAGRRCIESGDLRQLGRLMDENHRLLKELDVSSPELERLVAAARAAGALGAKLCGAGRGGNMLALVSPETEGRAADALRAAGAAGVIRTLIKAPRVET